MTAATVAAVGFTLVLLLAPGSWVFYRSPPLHVFLQSAAGFSSGLAAYLAFGLARQHRSAQDFLVAGALALLAAVNLLLGVVPTLLAVDAANMVHGRWAADAGRAVGAMVLAAAAMLPARRLDRSDASMVAAVLGGAGAAMVGLTALAGPHTAALVGYAVAAGRFARRGERAGDHLSRWLAAGALLAATGHLHYALYPSLHTGWVSTGDALRLGFSMLVAVGSLRQIGAYWAKHAEAAVLEERRRLARDLHDGLAQELTFIGAQSLVLARAGAPNRSRADALARAADRALTEARRAMAAMTRPLDEPLDRALMHAVEEIGDRTGARIDHELDPDVRLPPPVHEELMRIATEALVNATRHAAADRIAVRLRNGHGVTLEVVDDGVGFDPSGDFPGRYGLVGMRERAAAIHARLRVDAHSGRGTSVEIKLP